MSIDTAVSGSDVLLILLLEALCENETGTEKLREPTGVPVSLGRCAKLCAKGEQQIRTIHRAMRQKGFRQALLHVEAKALAKNEAADSVGTESAWVDIFEYITFWI